LASNLVAQNHFQDVIKYPTEIGKLERILFPLDDRTNEQEIFVGCSADLKPVKLIQRAYRPNPDSIIEQIRIVFYLKDTSLVAPLQLLYNQYLEFFQIEWGWAIIKNRQCYFLKKELDVIQAFERAIYGLQIFPTFDNAKSYYGFLIEYSNSCIVPIYYRYIKDGLSSDSLLVANSIGADGVSKLLNYQQKEIDQMKKLSKSMMASSYTNYIQNKYNLFGTTGLEWNYFSPYIQEIKSFLINDFNEYSQMEDKQSLSYHIKNYFFKVQLREFDYKALNIEK
jgi:hypothetical protein